MKKRFLALFTLICTLLCLFTTVACSQEMVDYASQTKLDMSSNTIKQEVTVEMYIDGDTTHFKVPKSAEHPRGILKARYLAVNTPESTGKVEEWGKKASNYTKTQLKNATSIIIETDGSEWAVDSTGERYLVWVWYKSSETDVYHNLNLELLQQGLAVGSKAAESRYGEIAVKAIDQASRFKLHVHSEEKDPDFYYGEAREVNLKELRLNVQSYTGDRVSFIGNVTQYDSQGVYVEEYDEETGMYFGIYVYYGFDAIIASSDILTPGNRVHVAGVVSYWEAGNNYQISDVKYDVWEPDNPEYLYLIEEGKETAYTELTAEQFLGKTTISVEEDGEEVAKELPFAQVCVNTSVSMKNLKVVDAYTTDNDGDNDGAMTLTCTVDGKTITVRTTKLYNPDMTLVTQDKYLGQTIDVVGIIDVYNGEYQIKVFDVSHITVQADQAAEQN